MGNNEKAFGTVGKLKASIQFVRYMRLILDVTEKYEQVP